MLFNSLGFLCFFPVVTALYFLLPHGVRWCFLLAASCFFYMSFIPVYIGVLAVTILIDYFAALWIDRSNGRARTWLLAASILSTCLVLFVFKYFDFFNTTAAFVSGRLGLAYPISNIGLILPIGLSFHTFQSLAYVIEVYRGKQRPERHLGIYALYVMFYPQLVAGPIERPQHLLPQLRQKHAFHYDRVVRGLQLMGWGFFQKLIIADRLAPMVNAVYDLPASHNGIELAVATVFFALQIYCDFAGYSNIAIGAAEVMGIRLMTNFERPYASASIAEFWRRWHVSLSTWFRDYLYVPLGGNRVTDGRWLLNVLIVFLVSGLWHGANWTFVAWGALHAFYLIFGSYTAEARCGLRRHLGLTRVPRLEHALQVLTTFVLVNAAWIFFRANRVSDALSIFARIGADGVSLARFVLHGRAHAAIGMVRTLRFDSREVLIAALAIAAMESVHLWQREGSVRDALYRQPLWIRWAALYALAGSLLYLTPSGGRVPFIYFQF